MKQNNMQIRHLIESDIDDLVKLETLCFSVPWTKNAFKEELKNKLATYLVMQIDDKVVAYAGVWMIVDEGHITNIAVHPEYRGKKFGDEIVSALIQECKLRKMTSMTLEVRASNNVAKNLYKKHGFLVSGIRPEYYTDNHEDAIIMWKNL